MSGFTLKPLPSDPSRARQSSVGGRVYEALRSAIVQLELRPGHSLSEAELASRLGVSRQPVREALIKLSEAGLVEIRPQRGTIVRLISKREVQNAQFLREAIEVAIVRKAASQRCGDAITTLHGLVGQQRAAAASGNHSGFLRLDEQFHQAVAASVGCEDAWRVLDTLKAQMDRVRYLSLPQATPLEVLIDQHVRIVDAIEQGLPADAEEAMHVHLREILKSLPRLAETKSAFFAE